MAPWCAMQAQAANVPSGLTLVHRKDCLITHGRREEKSQPHRAKAAGSRFEIWKLILFASFVHKCPNLVIFLTFPDFGFET